MKVLKLAAIPAALIATSAFAEPVVVDQQVITQPVAVSTTTYDPNAGVIKNTTTQVVEGTKSFFGTVTRPGSVSAEVGTMGYGANIGWSLNDKTELVAGYTGGDVDKLYGGDLKVKDVKYDVKTDFSNPYLGVNMRPTGNWFTVGAGSYFPQNSKIDATAQTNGGKISVNGTEYTLNGDDKLTGSIKYSNNIAPYLTLGFHPNLNNHWGLFADVGAAYMGKSDINVDSATPASLVTAKDANGATYTTTSGNVALQAEQELKDKNLPEWLPIVKVGATYRF